MPQELNPGFTIEETQPVEEATDHVTEVVTPEHVSETHQAPGVTSVPQKPLPNEPSHMAVPQVNDPIHKEIEDLLSENIAELYKKLSPDKKIIFKQKGEQVAQQITHILQSGILQIDKVLKLIRDWLATIPSVNKFFLDQEAKIKADRVQHIFDRQHS